MAMPLVNTTGFRREVVRGMDRFRKDVATKIVSGAKDMRWRIANGTPIDTGRHSASWNLSKRVADRFVQPKTYLNPLGAPQAGRVRVSGFVLGQDLWITNNGPVIVLLNNGWPGSGGPALSPQAPGMFVERIMASVMSGGGFGA